MHAGPVWGVAIGVKLTPATERHVHFPASMHDVPPAARRKWSRKRQRERLRKNEASGARKVEGLLLVKGGRREDSETAAEGGMMFCALLARPSGANCGARDCLIDWQTG